MLPMIILGPFSTEVVGLDFVGTAQFERKAWALTWRPRRGRNGSAAALSAARDQYLHHPRSDPYTHDLAHIFDLHQWPSQHNGGFTLSGYRGRSLQSS